MDNTLGDDEQARSGLADAARRAVTAIRLTATSGTAVTEATRLLEQAAVLLEAQQVTGPHQQSVMGDTGVIEGRDPMAFFPQSPVIGRLNPVAAPVEMWTVGEEVHGRMTLPPTYAGPPGMVHGGIVAKVFDELLGVVNVVNEQGGFTGTLTVVYKRPTPLMQEVTMRAWPTGTEGRKLFVSGEMRHGDAVTATAEGVFVRSQQQMFPRGEHPTDEPNPQT